MFTNLTFLPESIGPQFKSQFKIKFNFKQQVELTRLINFPKVTGKILVSLYRFNKYPIFSAKDLSWNKNMSDKSAKEV